jgi:predicted GIY-YIG superfamily endonuclease
MAAEQAIVRDEELKIRQTRKNKTTLLPARNDFMKDLLKFHETRG